MSSVVRPNTGASPSEMTTELTMSVIRPPVAPTWDSSSRPTPATARPPEIRDADRMRRTRRGANCDPAMKAIAEGRDHIPASSGDRPATSWRYCATNRK
jgi:hypothetical protein